MIGRIREADPELYAEMVKHGRRNIAMLTIAPTGTTSLMSQTTSGIEPVFRPVYKRRRKINPSDQDAKVAFVDDMGEKFEEIRKQARIDNFLAGTSQAPDRVKGDAPAGSQPRVDSAVRPTSGPPAR